MFRSFVDLCGRAYNILRKHQKIFINLFAMMLSTGIPELRSESDLNYLHEAFSYTKTEEEAARYFVINIDYSQGTLQS